MKINTTNSPNKLEISTDQRLLDFELIHAYLKTAYWSSGRTLEAIKKSSENSLCFGVYLKGQQIGFARVVTDFVVFAYFMDVFIIDEYQGYGFGSKLLDYILAYPDLNRVEAWNLATKDAHEFYRNKGFSELKNPEKFMSKKCI